MRMGYLRYFVLGFLLSNAWWCRAQKNEGAILHAGDVPALLHFANADFWPQADSAARAKSYGKYYSLYNYLASREKKQGLTAADSAVIDSLQLYITRRYLAEKYLSELEVSVTEQDAKSYYLQHQDDYRLPGTCSYIQIVILNDSPVTIEKAKNAAEPLTKGLDVDKATLKNQDFAISAEYNIPLRSQYRITTVIEKLKVNQFSELMTVEGFNNKLMFYVLAKTDNSVRPFEDVKTDCLSKARTLKEQEDRDKLMKEALQVYPIPIK